MLAIGTFTLRIELLRLPVLVVGTSALTTSGFARVVVLGSLASHVGVLALLAGDAFF